MKYLFPLKTSATGINILHDLQKLYMYNMHERGQITNTFGEYYISILTNNCAIDYYGMLVIVLENYKSKNL